MGRQGCIRQLFKLGRAKALTKGERAYTKMHTPYRALVISWQHNTLFLRCLLIPPRVLLLVYQGTCFWNCLSACYGTLAVSGSGHTNSGLKQQLEISGTSPLCDRCDCAQIQDEAHALLMCWHAGLCALRCKYAHLFSQFAVDFSVE